jgi:hypothetical protein
MVNPTWRCQLSCPYCLIPHIQVDRQTKEHSGQEWAEALKLNLEPGDIVDVAGGEPLLFWGLPVLLQGLGRAGIRWAFTTNALDTGAIIRLCESEPEGCLQINVSDHAGNPDPGPNIKRLQLIGRVQFNRVDHPKAGHNIGNAATTIPYQSWKEGTVLDGVKRYCDAGVGTWTAGPNGDVWRCSVSMSLGQKPIGNLFSDTLVERPEPIICDFGCTTCYEPPSSYFLHQRELETIRGEAE